MRALAPVGVTLVMLLGAIPAHAGRGAGIVLPPAAVDVGVSTPVAGGEAVGPAMEVLAGVHWASIAWRPTRLELGVGYVGSFRALDRRGRGVLARATAREPDETFALHGGYLALGRTIVGDRHFRTWVEVRGELLRGRLDERTFSAVGGALRVSAELYTAIAFARGRPNAIAIVAGTLALGVYLEASHRDLARELGPTGITGGFSVRVPFVLAGAS